ncbi:MAG: DNA polymerase I [Eubacteriales bacterium]
MNKKKMIIIDGNSLIYRTFYGVRPMASSKGVPTNAIYGFANILINILDNYQPDYLGVAFDEKKPTFRHEQFEVYKAGRLKMPEELQTQIPLLYRMLEVMDIRKISLEGYEADDLIGTISKHFSKEGIEVDIVTGDRDAFQLVDENIKILYTKKGISDLDIIDEKEIENKYGLIPKDLIEVKALMGDKSDNIPGVAGVGEKTALKLIKEYKTLEEVYNHLHEQKGKLKERLNEDRENAFLSRHLATIVTEVPVEFELEEFETSNYQCPEAIDFFNALECYSIANKLSPKEIQKQENINIDKDVIIVDTSEGMQKFIYETIENKQVYLSWVMMHDVDNHRSIYAIAAGIQEEIFYFTDEMLKTFFYETKSLLEDENIKKIGHNFKDLYVLCMQYGISLKGIQFDTFIASYLLEPSDTRYDVNDLAQKYLNITIKNKKDLIGSGKKQLSFIAVVDEDKKNYIIHNCQVLMMLHEILSHSILELKMEMLFQDIEMPLMEVLASFEYAGFNIDKKELEGLDIEFDKRLDHLTEEIYGFAGRSFNINSPKQLGVILFDELKLPVFKKTKTGYSTDADVLDKLQEYHPIIEKILQYRTIAKLSSTYVKGFKSMIFGDNHRIYSTFNQTVTTTGRISSSEPNLQNIPVRMEMGRMIRKIFIPSSPEHLLVDADYSQIELRILAHISQDETLISSFIQGEDIHTRTASEIFDIPLEEVTSLQRSYAKAINFGLIYGKQAFGLSQDLKITRKEAQDYINMYFGRYPKVEAYMRNIVLEAKEKGYVTTLYGRRRYIPEINSRNKIIAKAGERLALNTPIQGSAADIIKIAMVQVYRQLKKRGLKSQLILQVHDELIVDTYQQELEQVKEIIRVEMEDAAHLLVPLTVDINIGNNWYETK